MLQHTERWCEFIALQSFIHYFKTISVIWKLSADLNDLFFCFYCVLMITKFILLTTFVLKTEIQIQEWKFSLFPIQRNPFSGGDKSPIKNCIPAQVWIVDIARMLILRKNNLIFSQMQQNMIMTQNFELQKSQIKLSLNIFFSGSSFNITLCLNTLNLY